MFLHLVVLLSLSWPHVIGNANLQDEAYDQVATASENVARSAREQKEFRDQLIPSMIDTTVYENSNGFVPMLVSSTTEPDALGATSSTEASNVTWVSSNESSNASKIRNDELDKRDNIEHDPAYSTEARIFLNFPNLSNNRRSFEYQASRNEFELLKVRNDTPMVANYPDFYEDPSSSMETKDESGSSGYRDSTNGQKMQDYGYEVNADTDGRSSYEDYYSRNTERDKEKKSQVKANVNYHQQDALSYNGHGQTSATQNGPTTYFSRSSQQLQTPASVAKNHDNLYDSVTSTSQISSSHRKFSRPVVVAEPDYNYDHRSNQKSNANFYQTSHQTIRNRDGRFRSEEDSSDSDERDYVEYKERPRRVQKTRRRPSKVESKRLQKEHRDADSAEYESKRHHSRSKSHRQRVRNSWYDDDRHQGQEESYEDSRYDDRGSNAERNKQSKFKPSVWNQVSPNLEVSQSSGVEIEQLEKPKLIVPVKVNLVPVANFDHSTAIGNSQGFDVSNAVLQNIVTTSPPVMSTAANGLNHDSQIRVSTPVPDIIVGQNSYQNSIQAILPNDQNNFSTDFKPQFMSTTVAPVYAVTPSLQSIAVQGASTPRPTYVSASNQQHSTNQVQNVPQLMVSQPTLQTYPTLLQTPIPGSNFNIQVNPHGMHGQNFIDSNLQLQSVSTMSTVAPTAQTIPVTKFTLLPESQGKKTLLPSNTNFLNSAAQNDYRHFDNSYHSHHHQEKPQVQEHVYHHATPKQKTYIQTAHVLPALLQPFPTIATLSNAPHVLTEHHNQNQQYVKLQDNHSSRKLPSFMHHGIDNAGSHSTSNVHVVNAFPGASELTDKAHLPYIGTGNVEILNPNIKPSPLSTSLVNSYEAMHYPTTVLTTSIPMFTTTSFVTARPAVFSASTTESANVQSPMSPVTEIGSKTTQQSTERPEFNPIHFVPNLDLLKSQIDLNSKVHIAEPLQPNLNLVPIVPGGQFFKPPYTMHNQLVVKPKLNWDLANYAEQMFKESLKTIYNTQKWNNDRKQGSQDRQNATEATDIAKLKNELQRLNSLLDSSKKNKDQLEGHQSETKVQTAELPGKKPDDFLKALEYMEHSESSHGHHGKNKPRYRRPDQDKHKGLKGERFKDTKHIKDFMTPPKPYRSKGHFQDKPGKKRPYSGPVRYNHHGHYHGPRSYTRHHFSHKTSGPEAFGSNHDPVYTDGFSHRENSDSRQRRRPEFRKGPPLDSYSSFSAPLPDKNGPYKGFKEQKGPGSETVNQSKMHNLLGMWMKNKQLPEGNNPSYFRDQDQLKRFFEDEKQRLQKQFYDDSFKDYLYQNSEGLSSKPGVSNFDTRRSLPQQ